MYLYKYLCELELWYLCTIIHENCDNYSLGYVPPPPALKILMETLCSAVQLLVELTVVEGRALLGTSAGLS